MITNSWKKNEIPSEVKSNQIRRKTVNNYALSHPNQFIVLKLFIAKRATFGDINNKDTNTMGTRIQLKLLKMIVFNLAPGTTSLCQCINPFFLGYSVKIVSFNSEL